jgi:hypothetical protein
MNVIPETVFGYRESSMTTRAQHTNEAAEAMLLRRIPAFAGMTRKAHKT